jgi:hypothetical protein
MAAKVYQFIKKTEGLLWDWLIGFTFAAYVAK